VDYVLHFFIGLMGMGAGFIARSWCPHLRHKIAVGFTLLAIESVATVRLVG
jgi:hypothetical protein